jgi:hypothetical protein
LESIAEDQLGLLAGFSPCRSIGISLKLASLNMVVPGLMPRAVRRVVGPISSGQRFRTFAPGAKNGFVAIMNRFMTVS